MDDDAHVPKVPEPGSAKVVKNSKSRKKKKKLKGNCPTCRHFFEDLAYHSYLTHQADGNREHAESYGLKQCACGWFGKSLTQHWKSCSLHRGEQREAPVEKDHTDEAPSSLFEVLGNDEATLSDIVQAFKILAKVPQFSKVWLPGEARVIRSRLEGLCEAYCSFRQPITLFRIMAFLKVGGNPVFSKNRMVKRPRAYAKMKKGYNLKLGKRV